MEDIGYILSEAPFFALIAGLTVWLIRWRRARLERPLFGERDRRLLRQKPHYAPSQWQFYPRFLLAVFAVLAVSLLQLVALAPFGAAVLTATLILTSAAIVRKILLSAW